MPTDQNIFTTEEEKVERYQDLALEIKRIHRATRVTVIPIVIGAKKNAQAWYERCPRRVTMMSRTMIISVFQWLEKATGTPEVRGSNPLEE